MKLILTLLFVTCASAMTLIGSKKCTWGPSYWCSHITKARECGAFKHCLDSVWSKQIIKQTAPRPQCDLCQMVIKETRIMLKKNTQQKEVLEFFSKSCKFMPDPDLQNECNYLVNNDLDGLMTLLKSSLTEEQLCATVSLCQGFEDHQHKSQNAQSIPSEVLSKSKAGSSKICNDCLAFMNDIRSLITDKGTLDQIEEEIKQVVCPLFGQEQGMCNVLVESFVPQIMQYLAEGIDSKIICVEGGFCNGSNELHNKGIKEQVAKIFAMYLKIKKTRGSEECTACEDIVLEIKNLVSDTENQKHLVQLFEDDVCSRLGAFADQCKTLTETYSAMIFAFLEGELDGKSLCSAIGLCKNGTNMIQIPKKQVVSPTIKSEFKCSMCEEAVQDLDKFLEETTTQDEVKSELQKVCNKLSSSLKNDCVGLVDQYTPVILDMLVQKLTPAIVCKKACNSSSKKTEEMSKITKPVNKVNVGGSAECVFCKFVIKKIEAKLSENSTEQDIEKLLTEICDKLPETVKVECQSFVKEYGPALIRLLLEEASAEEICTAVGLCSAASMPVSGKHDIGSTECFFCEFVIKELVSDIKNTTTEKDIENLLNAVCDKIPTEWKKECQIFVHNYADMIIKLLLQKIEPKEVCSLLGLCTTMPVNKVMVGPTVECNMCENICMNLKFIMEKNASQEAIKETVQEVCTLVPLGFKRKCRELVDQYENEIMNKLINGVTPTKVCESLHMCSTSQGHKTADPEVVQTKPQLVPLELMPIPGQISGVKLSSDQCITCEILVNYLGLAFKERSTVGAVENFLKTEGCKLVKGNLNKECLNIVQNYTPVIALKFANNIDPKQICQDIKQCPTKSEEIKIRPAGFVKKTKSDSTLYFKPQRKAFGNMVRPLIRMQRLAALKDKLQN